MRTKGEVQLNVTLRALDNSEEVHIMKQNDHGDKWNLLQFESLDVSDDVIYEINALAKLGWLI